MQPFLSLRRSIQLLRSPERSTIAVIVGDPLKVRREVHFLLIRAAVFTALAGVVIGVSAFSIQRGVVGIEGRQLLQEQLYARFESMARLSHNVNEGREARDTVQALFPKDDNLLPFLNAVDGLARATGNKSAFRFEQSAALPAPNMEPYRFVTYMITLSGDAQTFLRYLEGFAALPYLVVPDAIVMQGGSGILREGSVLQLKGRLYVQ